ncbi:MAG: transcriptional regulator [Spirochaetae bacterium HGW-Spirochaetae-7]|jgi:y4mF family transcriptional regulator|nr:MAG: transcriptional regulator [Spirochaetae bacterium HGW-Spirochaetae-7]
MAYTIRETHDIGKVVRARRKALGYSQARVADLCGTGTRFISDLENGKATIELGKALSVLSALGVDIEASIRGEHL